MAWKSGMVEPVGVGGERGGLGERHQPGEQAGADIGGEVVDVGDPTDPDQLECQQRQHVVGGRDDRGAGVAGGFDHRWQVEGDELGDGQQQPGHLGLGARGEGGEVDDGRPTGVVAVRGAAFARRSHRQAGEAGLGEHLGHPGAIERCRRACQRLGDLGGRMPGPAQLDDALTGGVLGRCPGRPGPRVDEEPGLAGAEVPNHRPQGGE